MNTVHRGDDGVDGPELASTLPRPVGFVLGGGASLGAVQVGMLKALYRFGVQPDTVVGTSAGALNGAVLAGRPADGPARLADIWSELERRDVFLGNPLSVVWRLAQSGTHIASTEGVEQVVTRAVSAETFEDLAIPFAAVALDLGAGGVRVLDHGPVVPALLASAAIPGAFAPVTLDGHVLVDGGAVAQVPIRQAWERGARSIVVLDCTVPTPGDSYERTTTTLGTRARLSTRVTRLALSRAATRGMRSGVWRCTRSTTATRATGVMRVTTCTRVPAPINKPLDQPRRPQTVGSGLGALARIMWRV